MWNATLTTVNDADYLMKTLKEATEAGLIAAVQFWHYKFVRIHFTPPAVGRYGYKKRKGDDEPPRLPIRRKDGSFTYRANPHYSWRKRRQMHHNNPLMWSGQSRSQAVRMIKVSIKKLKGTNLLRAIGSMNLPKYFYQYRPDLDQPDKYAELVRTIPEEVLMMTRAHNEAAAKFLAMAPKRVRRRKVA